MQQRVSASLEHAKTLAHAAGYKVTSGGQLLPLPAVGMSNRGLDKDAKKALIIVEPPSAPIEEPEMKRRKLDEEDKVEEADTAMDVDPKAADTAVNVEEKEAEIEAAVEHEEKIDDAVEEDVAEKDEEMADQKDHAEKAKEADKVNPRGSQLLNR